MNEKKGKNSDMIEIPVGKYAGKLRDNPWIFSTIVLGLALIFTLFFAGKSPQNIGGYVVSEEKAAGNLIDFINAQGSGQAKVVSSEREGALYKVNVEYAGQEFSAYTTLDGKYLISESIPLSGDIANAAGDKSKDRIEVEIGNSPVKGNTNAKVVIIEFSDYECPFCGRFFADTLPELKKNYIDTGKARLVYKDFPLSFHPNAQKAAESARCAGEQGKYWEMHDKLFENQQNLGEDNYRKWAKEIGLNTEKFNECMSTEKYAQSVKGEQSYGGQLGISGTPAFFINGRELVGAQPYSAFKKIIEEELAK